jgi:hypothetical protein
MVNLRKYENIKFKKSKTKQLTKEDIKKNKRLKLDQYWEDMTSYTLGEVALRICIYRWIKFIIRKWTIYRR